MSMLLQDQDRLVSYLKKKGTGPTMSKSLNNEELTDLTGLLLSPNCHLTTKATIITAFLVLSNTEVEANWLYQTILTFYDTIPEKLHWLIKNEAETPYQELCIKVVTYNDLDHDEARAAFVGLFNDNIPEEEKAVLLEAERLKRETPIENQTCFDIFWERSQRISVDVPRLIDLSVAYDGMNRTPAMWVFVAPVLASLGIPCILHGTASVAPKNGITPHKILKVADKNPLKSMTETKSDIEDKHIGWGYIDQSISFPELDKLNGLRTRMVKRPIIATIEKLIQPIRCPQGHTLVTGYTHPPYREKTIKLLKDSNTCESFLIIRGQEGSIQVPTDKRAPIVSFTKNTLIEDYTRADNYNAATDKIEANYNITPEETLIYGLEALRNHDTPWRSSIIHLASTILEHLNLHDDPEAAVRDALESKRALAHFFAY